jgi:hypothetical protein
MPDCRDERDGVTVVMQDKSECCAMGVEEKPEIEGELLCELNAFASSRRHVYADTVRMGMNCSSGIT